MGSRERVSAYGDPEQLLPGNVSGPVQAVSVKAKTYDPFRLNGGNAQKEKSVMESFAAAT